MKRIGIVLLGLLVWMGVDSAEAARIPFVPTFTEPAAIEDSFLDRSWYGRLADFANVYAEPSLNAEIVRNVGDGYLFSSLSGVVEAEGAKWYLINPNEYVHEDDITLAEVSEFQGVKVNRQPERPFGWMVGHQIRPSLEAGGEPYLGFPKLDRYTFFEVYDAVVDDEDWIWYNIGGGRWMKQIHVSLVDVTPRPAEIPADAFWTEVDLYEQTFAAYEGDQMVYASLISSGLNQWPTNEGVFQVWSRFSAVKMSGAEGEVDYYFVEDVPHTMFFDNDIALHGAYWHDRFGYKHSHGCVNMPPRDSEWVYHWSQDADTLWVSVATADPFEIFQSRADSTPFRERLTPQIQIH